METVGLRVGEEWEGTGWYSLGGRERGHQGGKRYFFLCVSLECGLWGAGL